MPRHPIATTLTRLLQLGLLGLAVGLACWPLNLLDRWQDALLGALPAFGGHWSGASLALALAPLLAMPLLLRLMRRWPHGGGSGIPHTLVVLEEPALSGQLMGPGATGARLGLWTLATLALLPLGREGPVVQLGGAVLVALQRRWPRLLGWMAASDRLAVAAAAGLAAGFNTPLVAVLFLIEELCGRFSPALVWPGLVVAALAALVSGLGGQPEFALGVLSAMPSEPLQLLWAVPCCLLAGAMGALMSLLLLRLASWLRTPLRHRPLTVGLGLGAAITLLGLVSGGAGLGDGERLMTALIHGESPAAPAPLSLLARLLGPVLSLAAGTPGGLIDPALALGALLGHTIGTPLGAGSLALALSMAACLAGATQLPLVSLVLSLRLAGDQQLLPGMLLAAALGAGIGRLMQGQSVYHALADTLRPPPAAADTPPQERG